MNELGRLFQDSTLWCFLIQVHLLRYATPDETFTLEEMQKAPHRLRTVHSTCLLLCMRVDPGIQQNYAVEN